MNWILKIAAFKSLSILPGGRQIYRFSQERFTKSLVPTRERVNQKLEIGLKYLNWLDAHGGRDQLIAGSHLDVGAGWHPTIPLFFHSLGVQRQWLVDVVPVMTRDCVRQTIAQYSSIVSGLGGPERAAIKRLPALDAVDNGPWPAAFKALGCHYVAPYDEWLAGTEATIDIATCTQVLMHVPKSGLLTLFRQLHRTLRPGGKLLAEVHLHDLFANSDPHLTPYNHLQYSPETWERWINSSIMSFNRLKAPDYRAALEAAGFKILHFEVNPPTETDYQQLDQVTAHSCFAHLPRQELVAKHLFFVAARP